MGFLDKAKENLERVARQGQDKIDEVQSKKKADGLLRDLGAWTYAVHTGRDDGKGPAELERLLTELAAYEAEHGPLGGERSNGEADPVAASSDAPAAPTSPPLLSPPAAPPSAAPPMAPPSAPMAPPSAPMAPPAAVPAAQEGQPIADEL